MPILRKNALRVSVKMRSTVSLRAYEIGAVSCLQICFDDGAF